MRKITREACTAFRGGYKYHNGNTQVLVKERGVTMVLHGNVIAHKHDGVITFVTLAGWNTVTTRERLNGLDGVRVTTKNGQAYLNGHKWDGTAVDPATFAGNVSDSDTEKRNATKKAIAQYSKLYTFPYKTPTAGDCWICMGMVRDGDVQHLHDHIQEGYAHGTLMQNALKAYGVDDMRMAVWFSFEHDDTVQRAIRKYLQRKLIP